MTYDGIAEVAQARNTGRVNTLLSEGWVLVHIGVDENGNVVYILGKSE